MRQTEGFFLDNEMILLYVAKRLKEAQRLEGVLTNAGIDYLVEADTYRGGVIFQTERVGAFFYVREADQEQSRTVMISAGYAPWRDNNSP
jgi:hypothetical protein